MAGRRSYIVVYNGKSIQVDGVEGEIKDPEVLNSIINQAMVSQNRPIKPISTVSQAQSAVSNMYKATDKFLWNRDATLLLLELYKTFIPDFNKKTAKRKVIWQSIAQNMNSRGYRTTWMVCYKKFSNLKQTYNTIVTSNRLTGRKKAPRWPYFEEFEELFQAERNAEEKEYNSQIVYDVEDDEIQIDRINPAPSVSNKNTVSIVKTNQTVVEKQNTDDKSQSNNTIQMLQLKKSILSQELSRTTVPATSLRTLAPKGQATPSGISISSNKADSDECSSLPIVTSVFSQAKPRRLLVRPMKTKPLKTPFPPNWFHDFCKRQEEKSDSLLQMMKELKQQNETLIIQQQERNSLLMEVFKLLAK